jgi:hypothetical protein
LSEYADGENADDIGCNKLKSGDEFGEIGGEGIGGEGIGG